MPHHHVFPLLFAPLNFFGCCFNHMEVWLPFFCLLHVCLFVYVISAEQNITFSSDNFILYPTTPEIQATACQWRMEGEKFSVTKRSHIFCSDSVVLLFFFFWVAYAEIFIQCWHIFTTMQFNEIYCWRVSSTLLHIHHFPSLFASITTFVRLLLMCC